MDKNLKKGILIGSVLGGGLVALMMCKKGKEFRKQAGQYAEELFSDLQDKFSDLAELGQEKFTEIANQVTSELIKKKELAIDLKEQITEQLQEKWNQMNQSFVFKDIRRQFNALPEKTKIAYENLVQKASDEFAEKKSLGEIAARRMVRDLKKRWDEIGEDLEKDNKPNEK